MTVRDLNGVRLRTLRRYRLMFRTSTLLLATGLVMALAGGTFAAIVHEKSMLLSMGMVVIGLAAFSAYKVALSTMKLLDSIGEPPSAYAP